MDSTEHVTITGLKMGVFDLPEYDREFQILFLCQLFVCDIETIKA